MKHHIAVLLVLISFPVAADALDGYPRTSLAEDCTATWCPYCPEAYEGLDVVHGIYDASEFLSARYYATSGDLGSAETDAAIDFYGVSGFPTVIINGTERFVGGDSTIASGGPYLAAVESALFEPSPIRIDVLSLDVMSGDIRVEVTMVSETASLDGDHIRFLLLEDDLTQTHTKVTRDIINDTIMLSGTGNSTTIDKSFDVDPAWNADNLHAIVFVQRISQEMVQAASTYPVPDHSVRAMMPGSRMLIGPSSGAYDTEHFTIVNTGLSDTFTIAAVMDEAPTDWHVTYCDDRGQCHTDPSSFDLGEDESTEFYANVLPGSPGSMRFHFEVTSPNLASPLVIPFSYVTDDLDVLVVDDDGGEDFERYYTTAIAATGRSYGVWDRAAGRLPPEAQGAYPFLVWNVGWAFPSLDESDREYLEGHLDRGGMLFLSGQDIGWDLNGSDNNTDPVFYRDYLHARFIRDDTNNIDLEGVPFDPVTGGLQFRIFGGDGANNQFYPSEIAAWGNYAKEVLLYTQGGAGAIRSVDSISGARLVYLAFGFEGIDNAEDRNQLMAQALNWFEGPSPEPPPLPNPPAEHHQD